jgi:hypothetical protein
VLAKRVRTNFEVIKRGEKFLKDYLQSEVSENIRLELAHAYATWWNLSRDEPNPPYSTPETHRQSVFWLRN